MRINKYLAQSTRLSRRGADTAIADGRVFVNNRPATPGGQIEADDIVTLDSRPITPAVNTMTIMLNKPPGYVVSRDGQGSKTIYNLLPPEYQSLNPVGRLDKYSSGLLILTNDGQLAQELTHPKYQKTKIYEVTLDKPLTPANRASIEQGVMLEDGISKLKVEPRVKNRNHLYTISMNEGRNRQIRRTFEALDYKVTRLHRTEFGPYELGTLKIACTKQL